MSVEEFRVEQVICSSAGAGIGAFVLALRAFAGVGPPPLVGVALVVSGLAGGIVARDWWLGRTINLREERIVAEFPTVAELLALAVTAGESPVSALERVGRLSAGELGRELRLALADTHAGATLVQALERMADRFVDGMAVAIERGTPLADVLRAQAVDVREAGKRQLLEAGGRKEIAMMVPVVFLILPTTVIFAFYPALVSLTFNAQ
jgi:tight adherence protein C